MRWVQLLLENCTFHLTQNVQEIFLGVLSERSLISSFKIHITDISVSQLSLCRAKASWLLFLIIWGRSDFIFLILHRTFYFIFPMCLLHLSLDWHKKFCQPEGYIGYNSISPQGSSEFWVLGLPLIGQNTMTIICPQNHRCSFYDSLVNRKHHSQRGKKVNYHLALHRFSIQ